SKHFKVHPDDRQFGPRHQSKKPFFTKLREKSTLSPMEVLQQNDRLILLGGPRCGKSTLLKYWTLLFTNNISSTLSPAVILFPILVVLRIIADPNFDLLDIMTDLLDKGGYQQAKKTVEDKLRSGECLLLFDGLDEMERSMVHHVQKQVRTLIE